VGTGYIRQSAADIAAGLRVFAIDHNAEYNQLAGAFNLTTGHAHDASTGNGPILDINTSTVSNLLKARAGVPTGGAALQVLSKVSGSDYDSQWVTPSGGGYKNAVINGEFAVQQWGPGPFTLTGATGAFTMDRWWMATTGGTHTVTLGVPSTGLPGSRFFAQIQRQAGQTVTTVQSFFQAIPTNLLVPLQGKTCTLSARVAGGADWSPASGALTMTLYCGTGTEQRRFSPYTSQTTPLQTTINIPQGASFGSNLQAIATGIVPANCTQASVEFNWTPVGTAGAADSLWIGEVQLELGPIATEFERVDFVDEITRCQRFFWKTFPYAVIPAQNAGNVGIIQMHKVPTITTYNPVDLNNSVNNYSRGNASCPSTSATNVSEAGFTIIAQMVSSVSALGDILGVHASAFAEI
jgi:hypothetical protein